MPIEVGIWNIDGKPERVPFSAIETEKELEHVLHQDISILDPDLMVIGRQVLTGSGKYIDLLAIDSEGDLVIIELKRSRTPRDVIAQLLDYASWVKDLGYDILEDIFVKYRGPEKLGSAYTSHFGVPLPKDINTRHRMILVAAELDHESERIIDYLSESYGVPINALFFGYFRIGNSKYLSRTWLIDPDQAEAQVSRAVSSKKVHGDWNGHDFFVNIGEDEHRKWEDCRQFGFIAAGQSRWASSRLRMLTPGKRVFACISGVGYVGAGIVRGTVTPIKDFRVAVDGQERRLLDLNLRATKMADNLDDPDRSEYAVAVEWLKSVPQKDAFWEAGMFANQNPACRLRDENTLERLTSHFGLPAASQSSEN